MRIFVAVKPSAKEERVSKIDEAHFAVSVKAPAQEGKANAALIKALARYLGVAPSRIAIVKGHASRKKVVKIL